jgi:hypothetical protein
MKMKPQVALEFESLFEVDVDQEVSNDGPDFVAKFFQDAEYDVGVGDGHAAALAIESARIDARATAVYKKIADAAATKTTDDPGRLEKRANGKVSRVEITRYTNGTEVHAELDSSNQVIRTFTKEGRP